MSTLAAAALPRHSRPAVAPWLHGGALALLLVAAVAAAQAGTPPLRLALLLAVSPLLEETVLRLGLHDVLLRRGSAPGVANLACALAFGLAHGLLRGEPSALAVMLPALAVGALYQHTHRLRDAVLLHAFFNACWLAALLAGLPIRLLR